MKIRLSDGHAFLNTINDLCRVNGLHPETQQKEINRFRNLNHVMALSHQELTCNQTIVIMMTDRERETGSGCVY